MPQPTGISMVIEGRTFVQESPSFEQELFIMDKTTEAGLVDFGALKLDPSQDLPLAARQMLLGAYKSGVLFLLIAALMTEEGTEWTPEQAAVNAEMFRRVRDPDSKRMLQTVMVGAIVAFFESAGSSDLTSLISLESNPSSRPTDENGAPRQPKPPMLTEEQAGVLFRSGSMPTSSAKSRTTTGRILKKSSGRGKSARG